MTQERPTNQPSSNSPSKEGYSDAIAPSSLPESDRARHRYQRRLGLTELQWTFTVSVVTALPYLGFLYALSTGVANGSGFVLGTTLYSLLAIYANYRL